MRLSKNSLVAGLFILGLSCPSAEAANRSGCSFSLLGLLGVVTLSAMGIQLGLSQREEKQLRSRMDGLEQALTIASEPPGASGIPPAQQALLDSLKRLPTAERDPKIGELFEDSRRFMAPSVRRAFLRNLLPLASTELRTKALQELLAGPRVDVEDMDLAAEFFHSSPASHPIRKAIHEGMISLVVEGRQFGTSGNWFFFEEDAIRAITAEQEEQLKQNYPTATADAQLLISYVSKALGERGRAGVAESLFAHELKRAPFDVEKAMRALEGIVSLDESPRVLGERQRELVETLLRHSSPDLQSVAAFLEARSNPSRSAATLRAILGEGGLGNAGQVNVAHALLAVARTNPQALLAAGLTADRVKAMNYYGGRSPRETAAAEALKSAGLILEAADPRAAAARAEAEERRRQEDARSKKLSDDIRQLSERIKKQGEEIRRQTDSRGN